MADTRRCARGDDGTRSEAGDAQHREARGRIPAGELRIERLAVLAPHPEAVFAPKRPNRGEDHVVSVHEAARRPPASLHLHNRWGGGAHGVGELIGEAGEKG